MQEFTFTTSEVSIYETAKFVKQFAQTKSLFVNVETSGSSIHIELLHDISYLAFEELIDSIISECLDRKADINVTNVLFYNS